MKTTRKSRMIYHMMPLSMVSSARHSWTLNMSEIAQDIVTVEY